ncbi:MAG: glycoside hydrolase family 9 protein, partial [Fibrobacter sp.]|nr:glycoside hydrolase family 9 protein [Fibrobacter sp.]
PLDICYVTGFGQKSPLNPHHRIMNSDGIAAPIPGFLVGGPHKGGNDIAEMWGCPNYVKEDANSYIDHFCSYATNEVTINWNASFSYLSNSLEALFANESVAMFDWGNPVIERKKSGSGHSGITWYETANNSKLKFRLNLTSSKNSPVKFSIFNLAGKRVFSETVIRQAGELEMVLDKKQIGRGIFVLSVLDGGVKLNHRFIVK